MAWAGNGVGAWIGHGVMSAAVEAAADAVLANAAALLEEEQNARFHAWMAHAPHPFDFSGAAFPLSPPTIAQEIPAN